MKKIQAIILIVMFFALLTNTSFAQNADQVLLINKKIDQLNKQSLELQKQKEKLCKPVRGKKENEILKKDKELYYACVPSAARTYKVSEPKPSEVPGYSF